MSDMMQGHEVELNETSGKYSKVDSSKPIQSTHKPPVRGNSSENPEINLRPPEN